MQHHNLLYICGNKGLHVQIKQVYDIDHENLYVRPVIEIFFKNNINSPDHSEISIYSHIIVSTLTIFISAECLGLLKN